MILCILGRRVSETASRLVLISRVSRARVVLRSGWYNRERGEFDEEEQATRVISVESYRAKSLTFSAAPGMYYQVEDEGGGLLAGPHRMPTCSESAVSVQSCDDDRMRSSSLVDLLGMEHHTALHLGAQVCHEAQIRMMLRFLRRRPSLPRVSIEPGVRRILYENYIRSWSRPAKRRLLAERHNVMIEPLLLLAPEEPGGGSDRELVDRVLSDVRREIQDGLLVPGDEASSEVISFAQGASVILLARSATDSRGLAREIDRVCGFGADEGGKKLFVAFASPPVVARPSSGHAEGEMTIWYVLLLARQPVGILVGGSPLAQVWTLSSEGRKRFEIVHVPPLVSETAAPFAVGIGSRRARLGSGWEATLARQTRSTGFCTLDLETGKVRTWISRRTPSQRIANALRGLARDLRARTAALPILS